MPELPEVEAMRRLVERHCSQRSITRVEAREAGGGPRDGKFDFKVIGEGEGEQRVVAAIMHRKVLGVKRWGKHLWLELDGNGPHLMFHCGMTGAMVVDGVERFSFKSFKVDETWPPRFSKLQLDFGGRKTTKLAFVDPRRFGRVLLRRKPLDEPPVSLLGPDPLASPFPLAPFAEALRCSAAPIKALLLDQGKAACGVGNWVADEVLREARVHPAAPSRTLSDGQAAAVHAGLLTVLRQAVSVEAVAARFPKGWLFHTRWGLGPNGPGVALPDGSRVAFMKVAGRTTACLPALQRMGERPPGTEAGAGEETRRSAARKRRRAPPGSEEAERDGTAAVRRKPAGAAGSRAKARAAPRKRPAAKLPRFKVPLRGNASLDLS